MRTEAAMQQEARYPSHPPPRPLYTLRGLMHAPTLARLLEVPPRTARRWVQHGIPEPWQRLAAILHQGDLAAMYRPWLGWKLDAEALYSPEGWRFTRGELTAIPLLSISALPRSQAKLERSGANWKAALNCASSEIRLPPAGTHPAYLINSQGACHEYMARALLVEDPHPLRM